MRSSGLPSVAILTLPTIASPIVDPMTPGNAPRKFLSKSEPSIREREAALAMADAVFVRRLLPILATVGSLRREAAPVHPPTIAPTPAATPVAANPAQSNLR